MSSERVHLSHLVAGCRTLVRDDGPARWIALVVLSVAVTLFEAGGAALVYALLSSVTQDAATVNVPLIGELHGWFPQRDRTTVLLVFIGAVALFFLVRAVVFLLQAYLQHRIANTAGVRIARRLFHGYLRFPYEVHLRRSSAELIRNASESVDIVARFVLVPLVVLASNALVILGVVLVMFLLAPGPTLLVLLTTAPLLLMVLRITQPRSTRLGIEGQQALEGGLRVLQQSLRAVKEIRLLGRESWFERRYATERKRLARAYYLQASLVTVPRASLETLVVLFILAYLALTLGRGDSPAQTVAVLGMFGYGVLRIIPSLNQILTALSNIRFGGGALEDVLRDFTAISAERDRAVEPFPFRDALALDRVSFRYEEQTEDAVHDVALRIERGEWVGLVGSTGGGKSTLLDLILGVLKPTAGRITVDGLPLEGLTLAAWQRAVGLVPQTIFLLDDDIRRNVALGIEDEDIDEERVWRALELASMSDFVQHLPAGLQTTVGEAGVRLSGGQRQRIAIARALYHDPAVLVLDEGTSALDNRTERDVVTSLRALRGSRTILVVAHRLSTVQECDRILVVEGGRLVDQGHFEDLAERSAAFQRLAK